MSNRTSEKKEHWYICGQCSYPQYAIVGDELPVPCVDCGWVHREKKKFELPPEIKIDLNRY